MSVHQVNCCARCLCLAVPSRKSPGNSLLVNGIILVLSTLIWHNLFCPCWLVHDNQKQGFAPRMASAARALPSCAAEEPLGRMFTTRALVMACSYPLHLAGGTVTQAVNGVRLPAPCTCQGSSRQQKHCWQPRSLPPE